MFAVSCRVVGALPLAGETPSHAASELVVKLSVPEPVLVTLDEAAAGLAPPWVAVNEIARGDTDSTGCGGGGLVTVRVTVTVAGDPCAPVAVTVRCPVRVLATRPDGFTETWTVCV